MNTFVDNLSLSIKGLESQQCLNENKSGDLPPEFEKHLNAVIAKAAKGLRTMQADDGHWIFELEADATIPAEYVLLNHFTDEINPR